MLGPNSGVYGLGSKDLAESSLKGAVEGSFSGERAFSWVS